MISSCRSLWQGIAAVEHTLSQLQKVGDELAATVWPSQFSITRACSNSSESFYSSSGRRV